MYLWITLPFIIQFLVIGFDEGYFHIRRGLPKWERIGHPIDTFSVLACILFVLLVPFSPLALKWFIGCAVASCLLVTKDEFVHKHHCPASENWLHSLLFINHPIVLTALGLIWYAGSENGSSYWLTSWLDHPEQLHLFLVMQAVSVLIFMLYQIVYWNFIFEEKVLKLATPLPLTGAMQLQGNLEVPERKKHIPINNAFYDDLQDMWNDSHDHPIALLRAENALRNPWIAKVIEEKFGKACSVLDVGCGGGFLTNYLAKKGHHVSGIDLSEKSLTIAKKGDSTKSVQYKLASAYELPFADESFDVVCAMDLLEHVEKPELVIKEASRVLKKGGLFFFHTFNRNLLSYLVVIKGVEWCFSNTPSNMHVYPLFIKPNELSAMCSRNQMNVEALIGLNPDYKRSSFWKMVFKRKVDSKFRFVFTPSLKTSYSGFAQKL